MNENVDGCEYMGRFIREGDGLYDGCSPTFFWGGASGDFPDAQMRRQRGGVRERQQICYEEIQNQKTDAHGVLPPHGRGRCEHP